MSSRLFTPYDWGVISCSAQMPEGAACFSPGTYYTIISETLRQALRSHYSLTLSTFLVLSGFIKRGLSIAWRTKQQAGLFSVLYEINLERYIQYIAPACARC